jgi:putative DNA primase/helicase
MINQVSIDDIKGQLINNLSSVLFYLLPKGTFKNNKFYVGDVEGTKGKSLVVELIGPKAGVWHDFATNEGGDILSLWSCVSKLDIRYNFSEVLASVQKWLDTSSFGNRLTTSIASTNTGYTAKWDYNDVDGNVIATVYRYDTEKGKEFRPYDVKAQKFQLPKIRPLYNLPGIKASKKVVLVEGEKAAQALIDIGVCATTAMNGANAPIDKTDWSPLIKKDLIIWPDNDVAGRKYARAVADRLKTEILVSLAIVNIPKGKPSKWDAADAVEEKEDISSILKNKKIILPKCYSLHSLNHFAHSTSSIPVDIIAPRILVPKSLLVIAGAPKVGKTDFLLSVLCHMAAGEEFLGMTPSTALKIAYLQTELGYPYVQERTQSMNLSEELIEAAGENLFISSGEPIRFDEIGVDRARRSILCHFPKKDVDIIAIDPLRQVFDTTGGKSENNNGDMLDFLQNRLTLLRDLVNPNAAIILIHHTKKISVRDLEEEGFQALAGAGSLHGYFSSGILMYKPEPTKSIRKLVFELRYGKYIPPKSIDKLDEGWYECDVEPPIKKECSNKMDMEHTRKRDMIVKIIQSEAYKGNVYTINQFCEAFCNKTTGLGGIETVRRKLNTLATEGYIKFFNNASQYGLSVPQRTKYGYMCVEGMKLKVTTKNKETREKISEIYDVEPSHFKCRKSGLVLPSQDEKK